MSSGFDIRAQKAAAETEDLGTVIHIRGIDDTPLYYMDQSGEERPVTITACGFNSRRYRRAEESIRKRKLKASSFTQEKFYSDTIEKTVACTLEWDGFFDNGTPVPFNRENVAMLYQSCDWVLDQVVEAMGEHRRFSKSSSSQQ